MHTCIGDDDKTVNDSHRRLGENLSTACINQGPGRTSWGLLSSNEGYDGKLSEVSSNEGYDVKLSEVSSN